MSAVGIIVNPHAGKDIRRLSTPATHTSDVTKVGIVRRAMVAALETGVDEVLVMPDGHRMGERAADGLGDRVVMVDEPVSGSRWDTVAAARAMWKAEVGAVIALGGDGTARDVALGWPEVPLVAVSTGTNNIFPTAVDGTSAGTAAALVALAAVDVATVADPSKRIVVTVEEPDSTIEDLALVDVAVVSGRFIGARAVQDPSTITAVLAVIATPVGSGLAGIAGRIHPVLRHDAGGVLVTMGDDGFPLRVPLAPGAFTTLAVTQVRPLVEGEPVTFPGGSVLAFDGERDLVTSPAARITARIDWVGPRVIDVERALVAAARSGLLADSGRRRLDERS
ncbi:MAG: NAD(+)/NADH kinase [Ilumatobacteraceae bacterium]